MRRRSAIKAEETEAYFYDHNLKCQRSTSVDLWRSGQQAVPERPSLLSVDGDYHTDGIDAQAPAEHVYRLDGRLFLSLVGVTQGASVAWDVDLSGVEVLSLLVDDGGNGTAADWGVWVEPTFTR